MAEQAHVGPRAQCLNRLDTPLAIGSYNRTAGQPSNRVTNRGASDVSPHHINFCNGPSGSPTYSSRSTSHHRPLASEGSKLDGADSVLVLRNVSRVLVTSCYGKNAPICLWNPYGWTVQGTNPIIIHLRSDSLRHQRTNLVDYSLLASAD